MKVDISNKVKFIVKNFGKYKHQGGLFRDGDNKVTEKYKFKKKGLYFEVGLEIIESGTIADLFHSRDWVEIKKRNWFSKDLVYYKELRNDCNSDFYYKPGEWEDKLQKIYKWAIDRICPYPF